MITSMKGRIAALLVAAALTAAAVMMRLLLASTGEYSESSLAVPLRVASAISLFAGLALAGLAVAWPMRKAGVPREPRDGSGL